MPLFDGQEDASATSEPNPTPPQNLAQDDEIAMLARHIGVIESAVFGIALCLGYVFVFFPLSLGAQHLGLPTRPPSSAFALWYTGLLVGLAAFTINELARRAKAAWHGWPSWRS